MKSDFYFDPKEIHYMASREAADISFHQEIRKKMRSEQSFILQDDKNSSINNKSIIIFD